MSIFSNNGSGRWPREDLLAARWSRCASAAELPSDEAEWSRFLDVAVRERIANIVSRNLDRAGFLIAAPGEVRKRFDDLHLYVLQKNILLFREIESLLRRFGEKSVPVMPLKGIFLAAHCYDDPGERDMGDMDILIRRGDFRSADAVLTESGYRAEGGAEGTREGDYLNARLYAKLQPWGASLVHLHWHIVNSSVPLRYRARIDLEEVWREARPIPQGRSSTMAMAPHHLLCHLAEHAMKHSYAMLVDLADIARLIDSFRLREEKPYRRAFVELDPGRVVECARRWGIERPLYYGVSLARDLIGAEVDEQIVGGCRPRGRNMWDSLFERSLSRNRRRNGLNLVGYLSMEDGMIAQCRLAGAMMFAPPSEVAAFGKRPG
ncbi:MAG: hypothetical protein A2Z34_11195, partial [Planctomycetes bacterium RBG_16_59_8]